MRQGGHVDMGNEHHLYWRQPPAPPPCRILPRGEIVWRRVIGTCGFAPTSVCTIRRHPSCSPARPCASPKEYRATICRGELAGLLGPASTRPVGDPSGPDSQGDTLALGWRGGCRRAPCFPGARKYLSFGKRGNEGTGGRGHHDTEHT